MRTAWVAAAVVAALLGGMAWAGEPAGLVAKYTFDEGNGAKAADSSPNGNDGALMGGAQWAKGIAGSAIDLNGTGAYVEVPASASLDLKEAPIEAWFYVRKKGGGISFATGPSWSNERLVLHFYNAADKTTTKRQTGKVMFTVSSGKKFTTVPSESDVPLNQWCHLAATREEGAIKVYVNGEVKGSVSTPIVPNTTDVALTIGKTQGLAPNFADAMIDEVRIYNRALSAEEIAQQAKRYGATKK